MTREEAVKVIENRDSIMDYCESAQLGEALDMAIKALSAEPCEDAISRAEAEALFRNARSKLNPSDYKTADEFNTRDLMLLNAEQFIHLLPSVTLTCSEKPNNCEDAISRAWLKEAIHNFYYGLKHTPTEEDIQAYIDAAPSVTPKQNTEQFAKWVATEIFDDMWEYNKDAFAEIACRKLAKLGIVREKGNEWELVEPQESEDRE